MQALFERGLRTATGADLAYYPDESVAGRLRPGVIRSGDIYALESWQVDVDVVTVHGSSLAAPMVARLGSQPDPMRMYTVATTAYAAAARQDQLGPIASRRRGPMLRDLMVDHVKPHGVAV